jgi:hypothetical protein
MFSFCSGFGLKAVLWCGVAEQTWRLAVQRSGENRDYPHADRCESADLVIGRVTNLNSVGGDCVVVQKAGCELMLVERDSWGQP